MGIEQYDIHTGIITVETDPGDNALHFVVPPGSPEADLASVTRKTQPGSLRGAMDVQITTGPNNNYDTGVSFLHSVSNIRNGNASFFFVGYKFPDFTIRHYPDGINLGVVRTIATTTGGPGNFHVEWDGNASALGGTRITVTAGVGRGGLAIFDILDIFTSRISSAGEGMFVAAHGGETSFNIACFRFAQYTLD